jgi:hypothetical protein
VDRDLVHEYETESQEAGFTLASQLKDDSRVAPLNRGLMVEET